MKQQTCFGDSKHFIPTLLTLIFMLSISQLSYAQEQEVQEIFKVVNEMPRFPGCEEQNDWSIKKKKKCADKKLLEYVKEELKYPEEAKENDIEGTLIAQFIVEEDGSLSNINVIRGLGYGCDEEAIRLVKSFPKWAPGRKDGQPVKVQYNLPIQFKKSKSRKWWRG